MAGPSSMAMNGQRTMAVAQMLVLALTLLVLTETTTSQHAGATSLAPKPTQHLANTSHLSFDPNQINTHDPNNHQDIHESDHGNQTHGGHGGGLHLIKWRFNELSAPIIISIFMLAVSVLKIIFHQAECLSTIIPESCLLIIFGTIVGAFLQNAFADGIQGLNLKLEAPLFLNYLLPPIVLDSAYSLNDRVFFNNIGTILLYAVVGTLMNFFMIGPALYGLSEAGLMGGVQISFIHCLIFASFIVAVDPVAVLAIFQEVGVNTMLYFLVFGESLLNDAVTVVLYNTMKAFNSMEDSIQLTDIGMGVAVFLCDSVGSLVIGILFGILTALITKVTTHVKIIEPIVILSMAYLSYLTAELIHWSGIICMIGCGLVQAQYSHQNISRKSLSTVKFFVKMLASTSDCVIFLFLGLEVVRIYHDWNTEFVMWSLALCLACRLISVFVLTFLTSKVVDRVEKIGFKEQFIMWYGGLRGAVCFALCTTLDTDFKHRQMFLTATLVIVFFTVFIQGITIKPLVSLCKIRRKEAKTTSVATEFNTHVTDHVMQGVEVIVGQFFGDNNIRSTIQRFNDNYLRKLLQRNPLTHNEQILAFYQKIMLKDHVNHIYEATSKEVKVGDGDRKGGQDAIMFNPEMDLPPPKKQMERRMSRRRLFTSDEDSTMSDLHAALCKTSINTIHHTYDPNMTHDQETDLLYQLQAKHATLQENRHMRTANSPRNSIRRRSRLYSGASESLGHVNLAYINEEDHQLEREGYLKTADGHIRRHSHALIVDDKNTRNMPRKNGISHKNDPVVPVQFDNNLNLNNTQPECTCDPVTYDDDVIVQQPNGILANRGARRMQRPTPMPGPAPPIADIRRGHVQKLNIDPDSEEVTSL